MKGIDMCDWDKDIIHPVDNIVDISLRLMSDVLF